MSQKIAFQSQGAQTGRYICPLQQDSDTVTNQVYPTSQKAEGQALSLPPPMETTGNKQAEVLSTPPSKTATAAQMQPNGGLTPRIDKPSTPWGPAP